MFRSLYAKLSLALTLLLLFIGAVWIAVSWYGIRQHLAEVNQTFNRDLAASLIASEGLVEGGRVSEGAVKDLFHRYMEINPSIEIYLLDDEGVIKGFSADPGKVVKTQVALDPIRRFLTGIDGYPITGDDPRSHTGHKVFSAAPLPDAQNVTGYLYVVLTGEQYTDVERAIQERYILRLGAIALIVALAMALLLGLIMFRRLTGRLNNLVATMREFRAQDLTSNPPAAVSPQRASLTNHTDTTAQHNTHPRGESKGDEIDELNRTFNLMQTRIADQFETLEVNDARRREFIAHISHDLRTPIASINGYLETLQIKQDSIAPADRQDYINTALRQGRQLGELIDRLFELTTLDSVNVKVTIEGFSIAELVHDVVQEMMPAASAHNTSIDVDLQTPTPMVLGDIRLIERVLTNLVGNALSHTPPGTRVVIRVIPEQDHVVISVRDYGIGIEQQVTKTLFDPFVQGAPQRHANHAGLGLAIVKRILDLHDTRVVVQTKKGKGTRFSFALKIWRS